MSAPTTRSAYPVPVEELLPKARELAAQLGGVPSRNRLMSEFRIGRTKAKTILAWLREDTELEQTSTTHLRLVTDDPGADLVSNQPEDTVEQPAREAVSEQDSVSTAPAPLPGSVSGVEGVRPVAVWPVFLLALPAFVAIWAGWVGLGGLTGFGIVHPLPGIADGAR